MVIKTILTHLIAKQLYEKFAIECAKVIRDCIVFLNIAL